MKYKTYLVGGAVRDEILGMTSKDLDYVMLAPSFEAMRDALFETGHHIFVEKPEFLTIRAKDSCGCVIDYACARKDGCYTDGRHPDETVITTRLVDDLARRDFTCNAMAKDIETGEIIDPFFGRYAIEHKIIQAVGDPTVRFTEDKLRMFRALRFVAQKGFRLHCDTGAAIARMADREFKGVSSERLREELFKMFVADPVRSMKMLAYDFPVMWEAVTLRGLWLKPTLEGKP